MLTPNVKKNSPFSIRLFFTQKTLVTLKINLHYSFMVVQYTVNSEIFLRVLFCETLHMRSFVKIKSTRNAQITLWFTDICKYCPSRKSLASQMCLLMLFAKIKFSRKFLDLHYLHPFIVYMYLPTKPLRASTKPLTSWMPAS